MTKYSTIRLQRVPGSSLYRHFECRKDPGDEVSLEIETLYDGQINLSTFLIKPNIRFHSPTDAKP